MAYGPCLNPHCRSHGRPHPNCLCYSLGPGAETFADGGVVEGSCPEPSPHRPSCEYYVHGGAVEQSPEALEATQQFHANPELALDHSVLHTGLHYALTRTGKSKSQDPNRNHEDFRYNHDRGKKRLGALSAGMATGGQKHEVPNTEALSGLIADVNANPEKALEAGGNLGDSLPGHALAVSAKLATASQYLNSIKPKAQQAAPLDRPTEPSKIDEYNYQRQVQIVENPSVLYKHAQEGRLQPQDLKTLGTVYPQLVKAIQDKAFETLASHKAKEGKLTRKQREGLSYLLGQPLSYTQSPGAAQAIMQANAPQQPPAPAGKGSQKASSAELEQINKVNKLDETPLQARQMNRKS